MYSSSRPTRRIMPRNQVQHKAHIKLCTERDVTLFKDPDQVLQWVATARNNSAMNPNVVSPIPLMNNTGFGDNYPKLYGAGAHGIPSDLSLVSGNGFQYGTDISTAVAPANVYVHPDPVSSEDGSTAGLRYDVPDSVDMAYTRSSQSVAFTNDYSSSSAVACSAGPYSQVSFSTSTAWSSPSSAAIDPPFPHSYATHGFFPCSMASPQMLPASEDFGTNFLGFDYTLPTSMAETQVQSPTDYQSSEILYSGTIRPTRDQTRASIAENTFWSTPEMSPDMIVLPITGAQGSARPSKHGSANVNARNHHLYHLGVNPLDGLYYCPFGSPDGCRHKPEKLKCNYDKHVDSHLKPYRCKYNACSSVPFSSTACLLRHEREAHGMHGHGSDPFMCHYPDCDRGRGFPRRYNLEDHMKRMHGHEPSPETRRKSSIGADAGNKSTTIRPSKRRSATTSVCTSMESSMVKVSKHSSSKGPGTSRRRSVQ